MKPNRAAVEAYLKNNRATQQEIADALGMELHVVDRAVRRMRIAKSPLLEKVARSPGAGRPLGSSTEKRWKTAHLEGVWR
jgi:hypothetical protein